MDQETYQNTNTAPVSSTQRPAVLETEQRERATASDSYAPSKNRTETTKTSETKTTRERLRKLPRLPEVERVIREAQQEKKSHPFDGLVFVVMLCRVAASILFEAVSTVFYLGLYLLRQTTYRRYFRELILADPIARSTAPESESLKMSLKMMLLVPIVVAGLSLAGCSGVEEDYARTGWDKSWENTWWTLKVLADQKGDLEGLARDLREFLTPEWGKFIETLELTGLD